MKIRIDSTRIYLTAIGEQDTDRVIAWRNKPFVRKWFLYREEFTREGHRKWLENVVGQGRAEQFIIWVREGQHPIGSVYLRDIDREAKKAEFGIFIGEEEWLGRGIGEEAAKLILDYGFEELGLHKIKLRVLADNKRAIASYQKAGFVEEGYFRDELLLDGKYCDLIFMAKFRCKKNDKKI